MQSFAKMLSFLKREAASGRTTLKDSIGLGDDDNPGSHTICYNGDFLCHYYKIEKKNVCITMNCSNSTKTGSRKRKCSLIKWCGKPLKTIHEFVPFEEVVWVEYKTPIIAPKPMKSTQDCVDLLERLVLLEFSK
jgi:hypothetical protein